MNRIKIITCLWRRPSITALCLTNWSNLNPKPEIAAMGSEGDECEKLAAEYSLQYARTENKPLGKKWNKALQLAREGSEATHYLIMGSDDLISQKMWEFFCNFEGDFVGLKDYYFYDMESRRLLFWHGYAEGHHRKGHPIGAGKLISRMALEAIGWEGFDNNATQALDFQIDKRLIAKGFIPQLVTMEETGGISVDLKTKFNMHRFHPYRNSNMLNFTEIQKKAPELMEIINRY